MISKRENCRKAIDFTGPEKLPVFLGVHLGWLYDQDETKLTRIRKLQAQLEQSALIVSGCWMDGKATVDESGTSRWYDEWGTGWEDDGHGGKTESYPMQDGYHLLDAVNFPDANHPDRFKAADAKLAEAGDFYRTGWVWFTLFERLWMLRGFENMLMDPYTDPTNFCRLRDMVLDVNLSMIDKWVQRDIDGIYFSDDWGCQRGLLMNPDDWRRFYKPAYKVMFDRVHSEGKHVWMHLCGDVSAIIGDLIDIGLNVLNPVQPQAMDVRQLSRDFGGKVCFSGGIDVQNTMIHGTPDDVRREVDLLVHLFGSFNGGYIVSTSHSIMPETPLYNIIAMYEAILKYA